ncbi:MAG: translation initiation factor IF-2 [Candidatus Micrarchaeaceae archaeon]
MIRQPIIVVMGHVDHGKTSLLDRIRNTAIASKEAGGITQHIGASEVPRDVILSICEKLIKKFNIELKIPGLLFVDTPGHEAFTSIRKRGGSVADLAILVVDVSKGFEAQTYEAVEILKSYKTPFVVAANKIDLITGWRSEKTYCFSDAFEAQRSDIKKEVDEAVYSIVAKLSEVGFNSERFDRVTDFSKEVLIIPVSAKTGEGIAELLLYSAGLSERFLGARLNIKEDAYGRGSIIEKKEERGLGSTVDIILYEGTLAKDEFVAFASQGGVRVAKIRSILRPKPLQELRESESKFYYVDKVSAAAGVRLSGSGFDEAMPGSPILSTKIKDYEKEIKAEIEEVFKTEKIGVVLKADTMGSIEALSKLLAKEGVKISKKEIGNVAKRDVLDAYSMRAFDRSSSVVLAFNVKVEKEAEEEAYKTGTSIILDNVIYRLIDSYKEWMEKDKEKEKEEVLSSYVLPGKAYLLPNSRFRVSNPAIFGVRIEAGRLRPGYALINQKGEPIGRLKEIQENGKALREAKAGEEVAISVDDAVYGRNIKEGEYIYTLIKENEARNLLSKLSKFLSEEDKKLIEEIMRIERSH